MKQTQSYFAGTLSDGVRSATQSGIPTSHTLRHAFARHWWQLSASTAESVSGIGALEPDKQVGRAADASP